MKIFGKQNYLLHKCIFDWDLTVVGRLNVNHIFALTTGFWLDDGDFSLVITDLQWLRSVSIVGAIKRDKVFGEILSNKFQENHRKQFFRSIRLDFHIIMVSIIDHVLNDQLQIICFDVRQFCTLFSWTFIFN